ncbi:MAG: hypothetical protein ABF289_09720 [Clostridiales bacterium]
MAAILLGKIYISDAQTILNASVKDVNGNIISLEELITGDIEVLMYITV